MFKMRQFYIISCEYIKMYLFWWSCKTQNIVFYMTTRISIIYFDNKKLYQTLN